MMNLNLISFDFNDIEIFRRKNSIYYDNIGRKFAGLGRNCVEFDFTLENLSQNRENLILMATCSIFLGTMCMNTNIRIQVKSNNIQIKPYSY